MIIKEIYKTFLSQIEPLYGAREASVITNMVFESVANRNRSDMIKTPDEILNPALYQRLDECLRQLLQHKPVQYVLGKAWFCGMELKVNEQVLIPRPETEELVAWAIKSIEKKLSLLNILDIGITLKKKFPRAKVTVIDSSKEALSIAKENADIQKMEIDFTAIDFLQESQWEDLGMFDIIISNPPYIALHEKEQMEKHVIDYEPHSALFVTNEEPLIFYKKIARFGVKHLAEGGCIFVEVNEFLSEHTADVFQLEGYSSIEIKKDIFGKERMIRAKRVTH